MVLTQLSAMKTALKGLVRLVGTAGGIIGLFLMVSYLYLTVILFRAQKDVLVILLGITGVVTVELFGAYFLYVAFVVWRRFSPAAVHHVSAFLAVVLFVNLIRLVPVPDSVPPSLRVGVGTLLGVGACIAVSYLAFRLCRFVLLRGLFAA